MRKILIVDDEYDIVELLEDLLLQKGYVVEKAYNRKQAEAAIETFQPELMLLDIKLPDGDGIDFLKQIKKDTPKIDVIMVTGLSDRDIALEALKNGAVDYICKPIDLLYLTNSVLANVISNYREE
ncbi:MAG: response regulator [Candidatus Marinimicrobia bacterium]|nr:response regulator [Candidatus Neomarinimicrobiota bacterium]